MSYLKKFARRPGKGKTETITSRVPTELHKEFSEHCDRLGLSLSEAVYLLIKQEMTENEGIQKNTKEIHNESVVGKNIHNQQADLVDDEAPEREEIYDDVYIKNTKVNKRKTAKPAPRSLKKQFELDGKVPCPICNNWQSSSNFSRHTKIYHDKTTEEVFEEHKVKATEMYESELVKG